MLPLGACCIAWDSHHRRVPLTTYLLVSSMITQSWLGFREPHNDRGNGEEYFHFQFVLSFVLSNQFCCFMLAGASILVRGSIIICWCRCRLQKQGDTRVLLFKRWHLKLSFANVDYSLQGDDIRIHRICLKVGSIAVCLNLDSRRGPRFSKRWHLKLPLGNIGLHGSPWRRWQPNCRLQT